MTVPAGYRTALDFTVATAAVPGYGVGLEFEPGDPGTPPALISVGGALPAVPFGGALAVKYLETAQLIAGGSLPAIAAFGGSAVAAYDARVSRPEARLAGGGFEQAGGLAAALRDSFADSSHVGARLNDGAEFADVLGATARGAFETARGAAAHVIERAQQAAREAMGLGGAFETAAPLRRSVTHRAQEARPLRMASRHGYQIARALRRVFDAPYEQAGVNRTMRLRAVPVLPLPLGYAVRLEFAPQFVEPRDWNELQRGPFVSGAAAGLAVSLRVVLVGRQQEARRPRPAATKPDPIIPGPWPEPEPEPGATVVIPIRRAYIVQNTITLTVLPSGTPIPAEGFAMSIDADSWTWQWSASLHGSALALIEPDGSGNPVDVQATINGVAYRLCVEGYTRERRFANTDLRVTGRGRAAVLDTPYAPVLNHAGDSALTVAQLLDKVLTLNGVGIGWSVEFGLTDWLVPAGTWALQGSYIAGVLDIAAAAGAIVQPHRTDATLRILPRYPAAPWDWGDVTPDFELPSAAVEVEGIEWVKRPDYNRVFVAGATSDGVIGQVTRTGTAGDIVAPMVTHSLITHADGARQRGLPELANTGRQAMVTLRAQVLPETGIIVPGQFVRYVDGAETRLGLVRGTSLDWRRPALRQSITLETHLEEA